VGLEYLQRRIHKLSRQPVPAFHYSHSKEVLRVCKEFPVYQFLPVAPHSIAADFHSAVSF